MQIRTFRAIAVLMTVSAFLPMAPLLADQVKMTNGDIITGNISKIEDEKVYIEPSYADEFSVDLAEVVSIEADQTFEIELEDGSKVDASFAHGEDGMQTLLIDGESRDIPMENLVLAEEPEASASPDVGEMKLRTKTGVPPEQRASSVWTTQRRFRFWSGSSARPSSTTR